MHRKGFLIVVIGLSALLAACASSNGEDDIAALPTIAQLPTSTPTSTPLPPTATVEPTEAVTVESAPATEEVEATAIVEEADEVADIETTEDVTVENEGASLPFEPASLMPGSDMIDVEGQIWYIDGTQPVTVFSCPETTCTALGTIEPNEPVEVISEGEEWHSIRYETVRAYVYASFLTRTLQVDNPFENATGPGDDVVTNNQQPPDAPASGGFPGAPDGGPMITTAQPEDSSFLPNNPPPGIPFNPPQATPFNGFPPGHASSQ